MPTKILFATDFHFRATRPIARVDENFFESQLKKLEHLAGISKGLDAVILGGDTFDRPDAPPSVIIKVMRTLARFQCPVHTVIGNHEVYGYESRSVESSAIGILFEHGVLKRLDYLEFPGVHIYGVHAFDKPTWVLENGDAKKIIVAHKMITNSPIPNADCILVEALARVTNADLVLSGDIHFPHMVEAGNKLFVNPGSMSRMSIVDRERMPQAVVVTVEDDGEIDLEFVQVPSKPGNKVFNLESYSAKAASEAHTKDFVKNYASVVFSVKAETHKIGEVLARFMKDNNIPGNMTAMIESYYKNAEKQVLKGTKEE